MYDFNLEVLFNYIVSKIDQFNLVYFYIVEFRIKGSYDDLIEKKL